MIRALLVDDEEPARVRLRSLLADFEDVRVVGEAGDGDEALRKIAETAPDLVFLDIQMPGRSGMEVAASLDPPRPRIVFCTAFDQYAIDAFEQHALDYLLKPLSRDRLARAIQGVRDSAGERERLQREVADASETQARLFPRGPHVVAGLDYSGVCRAARGVGGDYYDFLSLGERRLGIALGDVSGKGLFAGLLMAGLQARLQSIAPLYGADLETMMGELNRAMHSCTETNRYATLFFAVYDDAARSLTYVNAGHNPPLLIRPAPPPGGGLRCRRLETGGTVIGLLADAQYRRETLPLAPGDILLACTDGVTEASNAAAEEFGEARLEAAILRHPDGSAADLRDRVVDEVDRFRGAAPQQDDITVVVARVPRVGT